MPSIKILLVEDDVLDQAAFMRCVEEEQLPYQVKTVGSLAEARSAVATENFQAIVTDYRLPDGSGLHLLDLQNSAPIIVTTGAGSEEVAVRAMKAGAHDYLIKDLQRAYLKVLPVTIDKALKQRRGVVHSAGHRKADADDLVLAGGPAFGTALEFMDVAVASDSPVFITGETGTGKNVLARAIHERSHLHGAMVTINCAALPDSLVEEELFGYERGAFTGAATSKKGLFEIAEGGTLMLDEIGEMPTNLQAKLLGVLDDKKVRRLGGEATRDVNVRVIAATSVDLDKALGTTFRSDLYYRLSVIRIALPPLRDRLADLPLLCRHLLKKLHAGPDATLSDEEIGRLQRYHWPGNIRELRNVLERSLILCEHGEFRPSELLIRRPAPACTTDCPVLNDGPVKSLEAMERQYISQTLARYSGNLTQAARALGISISTLKRKRQTLPDVSLRTRG